MNYRIRMLIAGIWAGIVTFIVFWISLITWGRPFSAWLYARMLGGVGMRILGIKVRVEGMENLPSEPSVLMANHQSNLDAFFMGTMYPRNTVVLGKREMLKVPMFGIILLASDNILVDREDAAGAKKAVSEATAAIKKRRRHLWIFPEGTRSKGKGLGEFKKGAFIMAIAAQAPIGPARGFAYWHNCCVARCCPRCPWSGGKRRVHTGIREENPPNMALLRTTRL